MPVLKFKDAAGVWVEAGGAGQPGLDGPTAVSADAGNAAVLGVDGGLFVPDLANDEIWVGDTDPYLADPTGAWEVWIRETATAPVPFVAALCPNEAWPSANAATLVTITLGGLIAGDTYFAVVASGVVDIMPDPADATQVADTGGEATWEYNTATAGIGVITFHHGTSAADPVVHTQTTTFTAVTSNWPISPDANTTVAWTLGGLTPGASYRLEIVRGTTGVVPEPLTQVATAGGTCMWTVTMTATAGDDYALSVFSTEQGGACEHRMGLVAGDVG